jgi:hypothetical protein
MKYATRSTDGNWSTAHIVDDSGDDVGQFLSLALDQRGRPGIAFFHANRGDLDFARFDGSGWTLETIDWKQSVGLYPSLLFNQENHPVISYYRKASGDLRLARHDGDRWHIIDIDTHNDRGRSSSMGMDSRGKLAIAYEDSSTGVLRVAIEGPTGWYALDADTSTRGVAFISLAYDSNDRIGVSYYDANPADLKFAYYNNHSWQTQTIVAKGPVGLYSQLYFDQGAANILYYHRRGNVVMRAAGQIGQWSVDELRTGGGRYIARAAGPDDIAYSWYDTTQGLLRFSNM